MPTYPLNFNERTRKRLNESFNMENPLEHFMSIFAEAFTVLYPLMELNSELRKRGYRTDIIPHQDQVGQYDIVELTTHKPLKRSDLRMLKECGFETVNESEYELQFP